jgi:hypothetical protein
MNVTVNKIVLGLKNFIICIYKQLIKISDKVRYKWLTPIILAMWGRNQEDQGLRPAWANSL